MGLMDERDKAAIVEKQIERLHEEAIERIKTFSALWRTALLGVAGVVALGEERSLNLVVLLAPPLLALGLAYWLNEQASLFVVANAIADEEARLNELTSEKLLTYESRRRKDRRSALQYRLWALAVLTIVGTGAYGAAVYSLSWSPLLRDLLDSSPHLASAYAVLTIGAYAAALLNVIRIRQAVRGGSGTPPPP